MLQEETGGLADAALLARFLAQRDQTAFAALLRRHGPMVLGVCRRVLRNSHDAEDAFQAVFLVLVRKAPTISRRQLLGNWLYGVAYRTALEAKSLNARRRAKEIQVEQMPDIEVQKADDHQALESLVDQELHRLPDKYRIPIVLCDLEGMTQKDAAHQLGWPEGTVAGRLFRGRELLARRLGQHGLAVSAGAVAAALSQQSAAAGLPMPLMVSTVRAAVASVGHPAATAGVISAQVALLAEGVLNAMWLAKLKTAMMLFVAVCLVGLGAGWITLSAQAHREADAAAGDVPKAAPGNGKQDAEQPPKDKPAKEAIEARVKIAEAQVEVARANVEVAKAQVEEAAVAVQAAESDEHVKLELYQQAIDLAKKALASQSTVTEARVAYAKAKNEKAGKKVAVRVAEARVRVAEAHVQVAEAQVAAARVGIAP